MTAQDDQSERGNSDQPIDVSFLQAAESQPEDDARDERMEEDQACHPAQLMESVQDRFIKPIAVDPTMTPAGQGKDVGEGNAMELDHVSAAREMPPEIGIVHRFNRDHENPQEEESGVESPQ